MTTTVIDDRQAELSKKAAVQQDNLGTANTYTTSYLTSTYADNKFSPGAYSNNAISPMREEPKYVKEETKVSTFGGLL